MNAEQAKLRNIIDMAFGFSAMTRVFEKKATEDIVKKLNETLPQIASVKNERDFQNLHDDFCRWFAKNVKTAERKEKNGTIKPSGAASYGQGAKVLDVALKVFVYYSHLPDSEKAEQVIKWLNAAVDNKMMKYLKTLSDLEASLVYANSIAEVDKETYTRLQNLVRKDISRKFSGLILAVQWDDIKWRELNKT